MLRGDSSEVTHSYGQQARKSCKNAACTKEKKRVRWSLKTGSRETGTRRLAGHVSLWLGFKSRIGPVPPGESGTSCFISKPPLIPAQAYTPPRVCSFAKFVSGTY